MEVRFNQPCTITRHESLSHVSLKSRSPQAPMNPEPLTPKSSLALRSNKNATDKGAAASRKHPKNASLRAFANKEGSAPLTSFARVGEPATLTTRSICPGPVCFRDGTAACRRPVCQEARPRLGPMLARNYFSTACRATKETAMPQNPCRFRV